MKTPIRAVLAVAALAIFALPAIAQEEQTTHEGFTWIETVSGGAWLRIHNYRGPVEVRETTGNRVEVRAARRAQNGQLPEVEFHVVRDGQNVTICAMPRHNATCDAEGLRTRGLHSDAWGRGSVAFTVLLPRGVRIHAGSGNGDVTLHNAGAEVVATSGNGKVRVSNTPASVRASTGNGDVEVSNVGGPVTARSGNGSIRVSTAEGPVNANTGNGSIDVRMTALSTADNMEFRTGNGRIVVRVPDGFQGEVDASTGNGRFTTDFPIIVQGSMQAQRVRGTIGQGGQRIRMSTGNGRLELRRAE
jgi:hypothetical protein